MYVELHARSAFSFLEGASLPEELIELCAQHGSGAMALLDSNGVYGSARFHLAAKKLGLIAHIGSEITTSFSSCHPDPELAEGEGPAVSNSSIRQSDNSSITLPLLVSSRPGYQNLCRLITQMKLRVPKNTSAFTCPEELAQYSSGLI